MTTASKVAVANIQILWSESSELSEGTTFKSFAGVDADLRRAAQGAPEGACNKVAFKVIWRDGEEYQGKLELRREHASAASILAEHMLGYLERCTMRRPIAGRSSEEQRRLVEAFKIDVHALERLLDGYQIGDESSLPKPPQAGPANDVELTEEEERARRLAPEYARLAEVAKSHWTGPKYDRERPFAKTAKLIRQELTAASKAAGPLQGIKFRVRSGMATHTRSLDIDILDVPLDRGSIMNPRRIEAELDNPHGHTGLPWMSQRGKRIEEAVRAIVDQYGFDKSDRATDYHNVGFYCSIDFSGEVQAAHRAEVERAVRLARGAA